MSLNRREMLRLGAYGAAGAILSTAASSSVLPSLVPTTPTPDPLASLIPQPQAQILPQVEFAAHRQIQIQFAGRPHRVASESADPRGQHQRSIRARARE